MDFFLYRSVCIFLILFLDEIWILDGWMDGWMGNWREEHVAAIVASFFKMKN